MAQPIVCDNGDATLAFVVMQEPGDGSVTALCGPCLLEWAYGLLVGSEVGLDLIKAKMVELAEQAAAELPEPVPARPARGRKSAAVKDTGDRTDPGESTLTPSEQH
jgi:hypothetical protein